MNSLAWYCKTFNTWFPLISYLLFEMEDLGLTMFSEVSCEEPTLRRKLLFCYGLRVNWFWVVLFQPISPNLKGKNIFIKRSGSRYFSNKYVPDISAWIFSFQKKHSPKNRLFEYVSWLENWFGILPALRHVKKKWCQDIYCNGQLQPFTLKTTRKRPLPRYVGYEHNLWRNGSEVPLYKSCVKLGVCTQYGWWKKSA